MVKNPTASAGDIQDMGSIPRSGRAPGGGHGNPLWYLAWRIPWAEEPCGLQSMWSQRAGHNRMIKQYSLWVKSKMGESNINSFL